MKNFIKVMKALSGPNRIKMVKMLQHRELCVCEIQSALGIAQPTVSKHLKILKDAGLVTYQKDGFWVNYRLGDGESSPYAASLLGNLKYWLDSDAEILEIMEKLPTLDREAIWKHSGKG